MMKQMIDQRLAYLPELVSGMQGQLLQFDKYDFIYLNEHAVHKMYYIQEGLVRLGTYAETGKEITFCLLQEGSIIGSYAMEEQEGRPFAQAFSEVKLQTYSEWEVKTLFQKNVNTGFEVFKLMGEHLRKMEEQFKMLAYCDVHQRIIQFLLFLADLYGYRHQRVTFIPHDFTHDDIARVIHTSRQTVTAALRELQREGLISYSRGEIRIYRYDDLTAMTNKYTS